MAEGLARAEEANRRGLGAILNLLGEHHADPVAIDAAVREYLGLLDAIDARKLNASLSIKPTQCGLLLGEDTYWRSVRTILDRVRAIDGFLWMDMEGSRFTDGTLAVYRRALAEYPNVGVAVQANLRRTAEDLGSRPSGISGRRVHPVGAELAPVFHPPPPGEAEEHPHDGPVLRQRIVPQSRGRHVDGPLSPYRQTSMDVPTFRRVLRTLIERYKPKNWAAQMDPFEALVAIIVSQNSTDLVTERVMKALAARVKVTPDTIAKMPAEKLVKILRPAGLARQKVPQIKTIARVLVEKHS